MPIQKSLETSYAPRIYITGEVWLGSLDMQSIMQANHPVGEGKGEPYFVPPENYLLPLYCEYEMN